MRKQMMVFCAIAVCAGVVLFTCSKSGGPTGPAEGGPTSTTYNYTVSGDTLTVSIPQQITFRSHCNGNTLHANYDTIPAQDQSAIFILSGNVLTLIEPYDTATYTRVGVGGVLTGSWKITILTENLPDQLDFGPSTVTATYPATCYGDGFMANEATYITANYSHVSVTQLSCNIVRLTGGTTGEQVTLTWDSDGNLIYSSSNSQHTTGIVYQNPTSCPNIAPDWYNLFLTANG
jgi:hypothetical protein